MPWALGYTGKLGSFGPFGTRRENPGHFGPKGRPLLDWFTGLRRPLYGIPQFTGSQRGTYWGPKKRPVPQKRGPPREFWDSGTDTGSKGYPRQGAARGTHSHGIWGPWGKTRKIWTPWVSGNPFPFALFGAFLNFREEDFPKGLVPPTLGLTRMQKTVFLPRERPPRVGAPISTRKTFHWGHHSLWGVGDHPQGKTGFISRYSPINFPHGGERKRAWVSEQQGLWRQILGREIKETREGARGKKQTTVWGRAPGSSHEYTRQRPRF